MTSSSVPAPKVGGGPGRESSPRKPLDTDAELAAVGVGTDRIAAPDVGTIDLGSHGHVLSRPIGELIGQLGGHVEGDRHGLVGQGRHLGHPEAMKRWAAQFSSLKRSNGSRHDEQTIRALQAVEPNSLTTVGSGDRQRGQWASAATPGGAMPISARCRRPAAADHVGGPGRGVDRPDVCTRNRARPGWRRCRSGSHPSPGSPR